MRAMLSFLAVLAVAAVAHAEADLTADLIHVPRVSAGQASRAESEASRASYGTDLGAVSAGARRQTATRTATVEAVRITTRFTPGEAAGLLPAARYWLLFYGRAGADSPWVSIARSLAQVSAWRHPRQLEFIVTAADLSWKSRFREYRLALGKSGGSYAVLLPVFGGFYGAYRELASTKMSGQDLFTSQPRSITLRATGGSVAIRIEPVR